MGVPIGRRAQACADIMSPQASMAARAAHRGGQKGRGGRIGCGRRVVRASVGDDGLAGSLGEFSYRVWGGGLTVLAARGQGRRGHHQTPGEHGREGSSQQTPLLVCLHILLLLSVSTAPPALGYAKRCRSVSILWPSVHLRPPHRKKKPPSQEERPPSQGRDGSINIDSNAPTASCHGGARSLDVPPRCAGRRSATFRLAPAGGSFGPWMGKLRAILAKVGPVWYK